MEPRHGNLSTDTPVACPDCDLLQTLPPLPKRGKARCSRCRRILAIDRPHAVERTLALATAALVLLLVANIEPLLGLSAFGHHTGTTIFGGVLEMWKRGYEVTAVIVGFCALVAPTVYIVFILIINLMALRPPAPWWAGILLYWAERQQEWAMLEVMMLGILISLIKLSDIATMTPGLGMYAAGALIALLAAIKVSFDPDGIWERIEWVAKTKIVHDAGPVAADLPEAAK